VAVDELSGAFFGRVIIRAEQVNALLNMPSDL
jgi:hypothetical protein